MRYFIILASAALMIFGTNCVSAGGLFSIDVDVNIDRAINQIRYEVEHVHRMLDQSLDKFDNIAEKHLKHIDELEARTAQDIKKIVQDVSLDIDSKIKQINSIRDKTIKDLNEIEKNFFIDLEKAIEKAECTADKIFIEYFANALGRLGIRIGTHEIRVFPPVLYPGEREGYYCILGYCAADYEVYQDFHIKAPNFSATYDDIKKYLLDRLENMRPDTPVDSLIITYSILSELARRTICFHPGVDRFVKDHVFFRDKFMQLREFMRRQGQKHGGYKKYEKEDKNDFNFGVRDDL